MCQLFSIQEIWKDIPGYEGIYQASNFGKIKRLSNNNINIYIYKNRKEKFKRTMQEKILKPVIKKDGYSLITLSKNNIKERFYLHRLIAICYIPNIKNKSQINHKDGNKMNNSVHNLEWCTAKENMNHAFRIGLNQRITKKEVHFV